MTAADLTALLKRGYRYALSLTHDWSSAEDLVQEGWAKLLKAGGPRTSGYLFAAIRSCWIDAYRRGKVVAFEALAEPEQVPGTSPDAAELSVTRSDLRAALAVLRPEEREVLFLHAVEGYTAAEIGELTSHPRNTVLSLLHRGKQRVRDAQNDTPAEALA